MFWYNSLEVVQLNSKQTILKQIIALISVAETGMEVIVCTDPENHTRDRVMTETLTFMSGTRKSES